jgi:hypothetical protein
VGVKLGLTLREEQAVLLNNTVLRKTLWPKKDEMMGEWKRLYNEQLYDLHSTPNFIWVVKSRSMRGVGQMALWVKMCINGLVGNPEGKKYNGRLVCRWLDNIKMYLQEVE